MLKKIRKNTIRLIQLKLKEMLWRERGTLLALFSSSLSCISFSALFTTKKKLFTPTWSISFCCYCYFFLCILIGHTLLNMRIQLKLYFLYSVLPQNWSRRQTARHKNRIIANNKKNNEILFLCLKKYERNCTKVRFDSPKQRAKCFFSLLLRFGASWFYANNFLVGYFMR